MEFRQLRYFVAVAEELNFNRAAKRLYISQQALSKQIRDLEDELEIQLFYRTKHQVKLTEAGAVFLKESKQILVQAQKAVQISQRAARGEIGKIKLSFVASALHTVLPKILEIFQESYPDIEIVMDENCTQDQVQALFKNESDVGFVYLPIEDKNFNIQPIMEDSLVVVLPENHPLSTLENLPLKALKNESFILHPRYEGPVLYDKILNLCEGAGFVPKVVQEVHTSKTRIGWVAAGFGISFVFASLQNLINSQVVYKQVNEVEIALELAVVWKKDNASPVVQEFLKNCREVISQLKHEN
ncbi:MAG: LysR family transcriptional regulator [Cyanobacteriota bacterium]|nr:LysR family transcriptional regulator [Cyanobacteriota bacterium]